MVHRILNFSGENVCFLKICQNAPNLTITDTKWVQSGFKVAQRVGKTTPRCAQSVPRWSQNDPKRLQSGPNVPQSDVKGSIWSHPGSNSGQLKANLASNSANFGQSELKMNPKCPNLTQNEPKVSQSYSN